MAMSSQVHGYTATPQVFQQGGCIPYRRKQGSGDIEVALISRFLFFFFFFFFEVFQNSYVHSSRKFPGEWVVPKGFCTKKESAADAASRKTWEEAGLKGVFREKLGEFDDLAASARITVWSFEVTVESADWPQKHERTRQWFDLQQLSTVSARPGKTSVKKMDSSKSRDSNVTSNDSQVY